MKYKLLLVILLCHCKLSFTQDTFQVLVNRDSSWPYFSARDICESVDGSIYIISTGGTNLSRLHLTKVNSDGIVDWDTLYSFTPFAEYTPKIIPAHDGGVIVGCTSFSYPIPDQDSIQDILLWKINGEGKIEWQTVIESRSFTDLIPTKDGNYFIIGSVFTNKIDALFCKVNQRGSVLWRKEISDTDAPYRVVKSEEIKGHIYVSSQEIKTNNQSRNNRISKVDSDGNILWVADIEKELPNQNVFINIIFEFDNEIYFRWDNYYSIDELNGQYEALDSNNLFNEYAFEVSCDKKHLVATQNIPSNSGAKLYRQYSEIGEPFKEIEIEGIIGNITGQIATEDGGFAILTNHFGNDWFQVSKVDCQGNLELWSADCKSKIRKESSILLYPNPTQNSLNVESNFNFERVRIYNLQGQNINFENFCACNKFSVDASFLSAGMYFITIEGEDEIVTDKFLKL